MTILLLFFGSKICGILAPWSGVELAPLAMEGEFLTTGPPGKSDTTVLFIYLFILFVVNFVIHWNESAMGLHVFPIPIPSPTSLSTRSL